MTTHLSKAANYRAGTANWVGGRVVVTDDAFEFHTNRVNRAVMGDNNVVVPLGQIESVGLDGGFLTKKVRVRHPGGEVVVRCFGAAGIVETVERLTGRR